MIISDSIRAWVRNHDLQDTLRLMGSGEVIVFMDEDMSTADSMTATLLTAAYMYFEIERERRSEIGRAVYLDRVRRGQYTPRDYFGYELTQNGSQAVSEQEKIRSAGCSRGLMV